MQTNEIYTRVDTSVKLEVLEVHRGAQAALRKVQGFGPATPSAQTTEFYAKPVIVKSAKKQSLSGWDSALQYGGHYSSPWTNVTLSSHGSAVPYLRRRHR